MALASQLPTPPPVACPWGSQALSLHGAPRKCENRALGQPRLPRPLLQGGPVPPVHAHLEPRT